MNTTRHLGAVLAVASLLLAPPGVALAETPAAPLGAGASASDNLAKQWLRDVWRVFRVYSPESPDAEATDSGQRPRSAVVAGLRGTAADSQALQPYWQGGLESSQGHLTELAAYESARQLAERGKTEAAVRAFETFLSEHPGSALRSGAHVALGALYAELGDTRRSAKILAELAERDDKLGLMAIALRDRLM